MIMELNLTGTHALIAIFLIAIGSVEILDKVSSYFDINKYILRTMFTISILTFVKLSKI